MNLNLKNPNVVQFSRQEARVQTTLAACSDFQKPREVVRIMQPQYRLSTERSPANSPTIKMSSPENDRSRSITKKNILASPSASRPNIRKTEMTESGQLPQGPYAPSRTISGTSSWNSTATTNSNPACRNGDSKKARYMIKGNPEEVFCSKCAISLVDSGILIQEITNIRDISIGDNTECELREMCNTLSDLDGKFRSQLDDAVSKKLQLELDYSERENKLNNLYAELKRSVEWSEKQDRETLIHSRNLILNHISERENNLLEFFEKCRRMKEDLSHRLHERLHETLDKTQLSLWRQSIADCQTELERRFGWIVDRGLPEVRHRALWQGDKPTFLNNEQKVSQTSQFGFTKRPFLRTSTVPNLQNHNPGGVH